LNNVSLPKLALSVIVGIPMKTRPGQSACNLHERFRLRFQRRVREALNRQRSIAESFGPAWEATLLDVPLPDEDQGKVYWTLINWARSDELFTGAYERDLMPAWRETVHDL
jgi:hypothetical protein